MTDVAEYLGKHPYYVAGGIFAVGAVLVLALRPTATRAAPSSNVAAYSSGPSPAAVQAATTVQLAQIGAQQRSVAVEAGLRAALAKNDAALQEAQLNANGAIQIHQIDSNVQLTRSQHTLDAAGYARDIAFNHDANTIQALQLQNAAQASHDLIVQDVTKDRIANDHLNVIENNQASVQRAYVSGQAAQATLAAQQQARSDNQNFQLQLAGIQAQSAIGVAHYSGGGGGGGGGGKKDTTAQDVTQGVESAAMLALMFL